MTAGKRSDPRMIDGSSLVEKTRLGETGNGKWKARGLDRCLCAVGCSRAKPHNVGVSLSRVRLVTSPEVACSKSDVNRSRLSGSGVGTASGLRMLRNLWGIVANAIAIPPSSVVHGCGGIANYNQRN